MKLARKHLRVPTAKYKVVLNQNSAEAMSMYLFIITKKNHRDGISIYNKDNVLIVMYNMKWISSAIRQMNRLQNFSREN